MIVEYEITSDGDFVFMLRSLVNFNSHDLEAGISEERVDEIIDWYSKRREQTLAVNFWLDQDRQAHLEQIAWTILRLRMRKAKNQGDPKFNVVTAVPLSHSSMDLLLGLDTRLPRLLLCPWACNRDQFDNAPKFFAEFTSSLRGRVVDVRPLFWISDSQSDLDQLADGLDVFLEKKLPYKSSPPVVEVGYSVKVEDPVAMCRTIARIWSIYPRLTDTLGWFGDGYVKRFYQLKEIWHLAQLMGREPAESDISKLTVSAETFGAKADTLRCFDRTFFQEFGKDEYYIKWRPSGNNVVLEFDLDSIADTHECQSPVFLNGKWILDREKISYLDVNPSDGRVRANPSNQALSKSHEFGEA